MAQELVVIHASNVEKIGAKLDDSSPAALSASLDTLIAAADFPAGSKTPAYLKQHCTSKEACVMTLKSLPAAAEQIASHIK